MPLWISIQPITIANQIRGKTHLHAAYNRPILSIRLGGKGIFKKSYKHLVKENSDFKTKNPS